MKVVLVGLMLSLTTASYASVAMHVSQQNTSRGASSQSLLSQIDTTLGNMNTSTNANWKDLKKGLNEIGKDIKIIADSLATDSSSSLDEDTTPVFPKVDQSFLSRGQGRDQYNKLVSAILCNSSTSKLCSQDKTPVINSTYLSSNVLPFEKKLDQKPNEYIINLFGGGGKMNLTNLQVDRSINSAQTLSIQLLNHIASQNESMAGNSYTTGYSLVNDALTQFYAMPQIAELTSSMSQIDVLKLIARANVILTMIESEKMKQAQTNNASHGVLIAQLALISKQNQKLIKLNQRRNKLLNKLVSDKNSGEEQ